MQNDQTSKLEVALHYLSDKAVDLFQYLRDLATPFIEEGLYRAQPAIEGAKEFYQDHKQAILIVSVASLTYMVMRPKSRDDDKNKKKKMSGVKKQLVNKKFISDDSAEQYKEEPSTTIRVESSGKEALKRRNEDRNVLQRVQSSSEQESGEKIFFEMYRNYQISQN